MLLFGIVFWNLIHAKLKKKILQTLHKALFHSFFSMDCDPKIMVVGRPNTNLIKDFQKVGQWSSWSSWQWSKQEQTVAYGLSKGVVKNRRMVRTDGKTTKTVNKSRVKNHENKTQQCV